MSDSENTTGLANSFTDLMTSLAIIFILLLCTFVNNAFEDTRSTKQNILEMLQKELAEFYKDGVRVITDPKDPLTLLILVPEDLLKFPVDKYDVSQKGKSFLNLFIPKLTRTIYNEQFRGQVNSVVVEGHADPSGNDEHNLWLSQQRSLAVANHCLTIISDNEAKDFFLDVLSATGRGNRDPIIVDQTIDYAQSRRVQFKIRVRSLEERTFKTTLSTRY